MIARWVAGIFLVLSSVSSVQAAATVNLRVDPLQVLVGTLSAGLDFEIADEWTFGPRFHFMNSQLGDYKFLTWGAGGRFNYYLSGKNFSRGWYWGSSVEYRFVKVERNSTLYGQVSGETSGLSTTQIFGYGWYWGNFNMSVGGGAQIAPWSRALELKDTSGVKREDFSNYFASVGFTPTVEFNIGFLF